MLQHKVHRPFPNLHWIPPRSCHCSILSQLGASTFPRAVQGARHMVTTPTGLRPTAKLSASSRPSSRSRLTLDSTAPPRDAYMLSLGGAVESSVSLLLEEGLDE